MFILSGSYVEKGIIDLGKAIGNLVINDYKELLVKRKKQKQNIN